MVKLNNSGVVFNEGDHTYFLGDKKLEGITGMLHQMLFKDMYKGIPDNILAKAAERGTYIHKMCEAVDSFGATPTECEEAMNHIRLTKEHSLVSVACEYLVTDGEHFASAIDAIYMGNGENVVDLYDRKTTSKLHKDYISWQLSIYAYLFERQNPHLKVGKLCAEWLRGTIAEIVEVDRHPKDEIEALLLAYIDGNGYEVDNTTPEYIKSTETAILMLKKKIDDLTAQYEELTKELEEAMQKDGLKTFSTDSVTYTLVAPTTSMSFDSARFKKEHPEMIEKYQRTTNKKGFIKLTFKN